MAGASIAVGGDHEVWRIMVWGGVGLCREEDVLLQLHAPGGALGHPPPPPRQEGYPRQ